MIEVARLHAAEAGLQIDYRLAALETLLGDHCSAPALMSSPAWRLLEHVPQPADTVHTLAKLLRPGAPLFVSTIHRNLRHFC